MPVDITAGEANAALGLGEHVGHFDDRTAGEIADAVDRIEPGKTEHQVAEIIDQRRISQAQTALEDIFAKAGKKAGQTRRRGQNRS